MRSFKLLHDLHWRLALVLLMILPLFLTPTPAAARGKPARTGAVYTQTNDPDGNQVLIYVKTKNGRLAFDEAVATGGAGTGSGLGSQEAVVLSQDGRRLFVVNAGSDDISVFAVQPGGLALVEREPSGGEMPISMALHGNLLYVLNAGASGGIMGFWVGADGSLTPIPGSSQALSNGGLGAAPGPAQISFTPDGKTLVVTEKATNLILTYAVAHDTAAPAMIHPSAGMTPFGFGFNQRGVLVVSEAFGGQPGASALSSYFVAPNQLEVVSASVPTTQTAACWIAISRNGRFAFTTNAGSSSISSYRIGQDGSLSLLEAVSASTGAGSAPIDMAFDRAGKFLYALSSNVGHISIYVMGPNGQLLSLGDIAVPAGSVGLAAR